MSSLRLIVHAVVALVVGAASTLAVSTVIAWARPLKGDAGFAETRIDRVRWDLRRERGPGWFTCQASGYLRRCIPVPPPAPPVALDEALPRWSPWRPNDQLSWTYVCGTGWPSIAMVGWQDTRFAQQRHALHALGPVDRRGFPERAIPLQPIPAGFAINTAFYASPWLLLIAMRAIVRRRQGRCPRCAYDLRQAAELGCPECGWRRRPHEHHSSARLILPRP